MPLIYLEFRLFANSIKNTFRSPKRLIPALIITAWAVSWLVYGLLALSGAPAGPVHGMVRLKDTILPSNIPAIDAAIFLFLSVGCVLVVYQAFSSGMLVFSIAHIDFLFATPISRRKVLLIKLLKDYLRYGFYVAFFFLLIGAPVLNVLKVDLLPDGLWAIAGLLALMLFVVNIAHTINIVFTFGFERLKQAGIAIKAALIACLLVVLVVGLVHYVHSGDASESLFAAANSRLVSGVFAPAKWCARLVLAPLLGVTSEDRLHLSLLWVLAAGSFVLLITRRENIYEPSLGVSTRHAQRRQAIRTGDFAALRMAELRERGTRRVRSLRVPPFGRGAAALFWRSIVTRFRVSRNQTILALALPFIAAALLSQFDGDSSFHRHIPIALPYIAWLLSMTFQPMRAELKYANILKAMPVPAWKVMFVHAATATLQLAIGTSAFALAMWAVLPHSRGDLLLVCAAGAPLIGFAGICAVMVASLLYPDATDLSQNYICQMVAFLLGTVVLVPNIAVGLTLILKGIPPWVDIAVLAVLNAALGGLGIAASGAVYRRWEPTGD